MRQPSLSGIGSLFGRSALLTVLLASVHPAGAAGLTVTSGGSFSVDNGALYLDCTDITIDPGGDFFLGNGTAAEIVDVANAGLLDGGTGSLFLSGNWTNTGQFIPGNSAVHFGDGCGSQVSVLSGSSDFYGLYASTASGHELRFESGQEQRVANSLVLDGAPGNRLLIRSTQTGSPGFLTLDAGGTQNIDHVDVQDNHANLPGQHLAPAAPQVFNSVDSGGNFRWFIKLMTQPIPTLSTGGIVLLGLLLLLTLLIRQRRPSRGRRP